MNQELKKRILSFIWRFGAYLVVSALAYILESIGALTLPVQIYALIAYIIGEITKYLNKKYQLKDPLVADPKVA